jgi:hypothetical protein
MPGAPERLQAAQSNLNGSRLEGPDRRGGPYVQESADRKRPACGHRPEAAGIVMLGGYQDRSHRSEVG